MKVRFFTVTYLSSKRGPDIIHGIPSNYIYCNVCDSLVFIPENGYSSANCYRDNHFKSCINEDTISKEHTRRKEILESIDRREFQIWQYKQFILKEEAKMKRLHLELFSNSISHSEKDKLASVSYDSDARSSSYEAYVQSKATVEKNTILSASSFEPTPPPLSQKPVELIGSLERYPMQRSASAPEIRNLWNDQSNVHSRTALGNLAEAYFDSVRKNAERK